MDVVSKSDLKLLAGPNQSGTCVSLFIPTHRFGDDVRADPIKWKNLLVQAESVLAERGLGAAAISEVLKPAWTLHGDALAWQHMSDGLAMFLRPGWNRSYRVPVRVPEIATVGDDFIIGPLLPIVTGDSDFLILAVSQRRVRLFKGSRQHAEELELNDVPTSLRDVIEPPEPRSHTMTVPASSGGSAGQAVFHGHGAGDDHFKKEEVHWFLRQVADGLRAHLRDQDAPMVLAGLEQLMSAYREVNTYSHVLDDEVRSNPDDLSAEELHAAAWPVIERTLARRCGTEIDRFGQLHGTGRASSDPTKIMEAAQEGRVETLFLVGAPSCWEQASSDTVVVRLGVDAAFAYCELIEDAATESLLRGSKVYTLDAADVPGGGDIAAVFRY